MSLEELADRLEQKIERIAETAHELNRLYCRLFMDDNTQLPWAEAAEWQKDSARTGVRLLLTKPDQTPEAQHIAWSNDKIAAGWVYGEVKDAEKKTHPCLVEYEDLPEEQRIKDVLFVNTVNALLGRIKT